MGYQKIPLKEQLGRAVSGEAVHPEYAASLIRGLADMPMPEYMEDAQCRYWLEHALGLPHGRLDGMAFREAAALIPSPEESERGAQALRLFAAPIAEGYWKKEGESHAEDTA